MVAKMRDVAVWTLWELIIPGTPYSPRALRVQGPLARWP